MEFKSPHQKIIEQAITSRDGDEKCAAITTSTVNAMLRELAAWLAQNPDEQQEIPRALFGLSEDATMFNRMTSNYIRNIMNRVPEVAAVGRVRVKSITSEHGGQAFQIGIALGQMQRKYRDRPGIDEVARKEMARQILSSVREFKVDIRALSGCESILDAAEAVRVEFVKAVDAEIEKAVEE